MPRCRRSVSVIWVPIVSVGFRDVIGSWKIIPISCPRTSSSCDPFSFNRSRPWKTALPSTTRPGGSMSPMIDSIETDLPQPDSPTMPSIVPRSTVKETPSTARTSPSRVLKNVCRLFTASRGIRTPSAASSRARAAPLRLPRPRVERIPESVGDEEGAEDQPADRQARDDDDVRVRLVGRVTVLGERSPGGLGRVDAEADERQEGLAEDDARKLEEDEDQDHAQRVG